MREVATQVEPPLIDKEIIAMFIDTLQPPFYEHMIGSVSANFADIVIIGERIELGLKNGKIAHGSSVVANPKKHGFNFGRKEEEAQVVSTIPNWGSRVVPHYYQKPEYIVNAMPVYHPQTHEQGLHQPPLVQNNSNQGQGQGQNMSPKRNPS